MPSIKKNKSTKIVPHCKDQKTKINKKKSDFNKTLKNLQKIDKNLKNLQKFDKNIRNLQETLDCTNQFLYNFQVFVNNNQKLITNGGKSKKKSC